MIAFNDTPIVILVPPDLFFFKKNVFPNIKYIQDIKASWQLCSATCLSEYMNLNSVFSQITGQTNNPVSKSKPPTDLRNLDDIMTVSL